MGDRCYAHIEIGGKIRKSLQPDFEKALKSEFYFKESLEEFVKANIGLDGTLEMEDNEVNYGNFGDLENFCVKHKIPFNRQNAAGDEYGPGSAIYFPDTGLVENQTNEQGSIVSLNYLRNILKGLAERITIEKAPLYINSEDEFQKAYAEHLLKHGAKDAVEFALEYVNKQYPDVEDREIPKFELEV